MQRRSKRTLTVLLLLILSLFTVFLTGCSSKEAKDEFFAMDTFMSLLCYGKNSDSCVKEIREMIYRADNQFNPEKEGSPLYELNEKKELKAPEMLLEAVKGGLKYSKDTDHALDITIYPVVRDWGFDSGDYHLPNEKTLLNDLKKVDYRNVKIKGDSIYLKNEASITLGAVAKGYCTDRAVNICKEKGIDSALINLGGNIFALGENRGKAWVIGVEDPFNPGEVLGHVSIKDRALVTSGDYERFFQAKGKRYHHIMDYRTGYPAESGLRQVTVICRDALKGDCLSTALFVMGKEGAVNYWKKDNGDFDMILVDSKGKIFYTEGLEKSFVNTSRMDMERIELGNNHENKE